MNIRDVEKLCLYIKKECYQGSQWSHPIMFKGFVDGKHFSEMDKKFFLHVAIKRFEKSLQKFWVQHCT